MNYIVHRKEKRYFAIMAAIGGMFYAGLVAGFLLSSIHSISMIYLGLFAFLALLQIVAMVFLVGHLRGNAIKITPKQFPAIYEVIKNQSEKLGLPSIPDMYLLQNGGTLNAFAMRFAGRNYVVMLSGVLAAAYQEGLPAVEFIIGHELGHIKRKHLSPWRALLLLPARVIPFLANAYSRACEYTCDAIGASLCPEGAEKGIFLLAAGTNLYKQVNSEVLLAQARTEQGFATELAELFSTHPHLVNRIAQFDQLLIKKEITVSPRVVGETQAQSEA